MLGLPELLVLDEPTDGLDPPQIAEMRRVLRRYATDGRAVLVSTHLLAEVEQTCTHVVVMQQGRGRRGRPGRGDRRRLAEQRVIDVSDPEAAADGARPAATGALSSGAAATVGWSWTRRHAPGARWWPRWCGAGVGVDRVVPRRRLEDAFLALVGDDTKGSGDR